MNIIFQNSIFGFQPLILHGVPIFQADLTHVFQKQQIEPETFRKKKVTVSDVLYIIFYQLLVKFLWRKHILSDFYWAHLLGHVWFGIRISRKHKKLGPNPLGATELNHQDRQANACQVSRLSNLNLTAKNSENRSLLFFQPENVQGFWLLVSGIRYH